MLSALLALTMIFSASMLSAERTAKDVYSLLTIQDYAQACCLGKDLCDADPNNQEVQVAYIQALARKGDERAMAAAWDRYLQCYPDDAYDRALLESMAWGILEKGVQSHSPIVRTYALLGAFFGQDTRGVKMLSRSLDDSCVSIRVVAVQLASNFRDVLLQEGVFQLLKKERNTQVRVEVIRAVGKMKIQKAKATLVAIVSDDRASAEEKAAAMESLVYLFETIQLEEVAKLVQSNRAGLRQLACQVVAAVGEPEDVPLLFPLLKDPSADVRCAALQTIGLLRLKEWQGQPVVRQMAPLLADPHPEVAVIAAWAVTLENPALGLQAFEKLLQSPNADVRWFAGGALAATGTQGGPLLRKTFASAEDPLLKTNLALGLVAQKEMCKEACEAIYQTLRCSETLMWEEKGPFKYLVQNRAQYSAMKPNQPEVINQLTRLELLNILSVMDNPHAQEGIKNFLTERAWGVTGLAAVLLLTEGDEQALQHVEVLLQDPNKKVQVQAALILALWGKGEGAIHVLQEAYDGADREMKEHLIEGIGHVGARSSLPFLVQRLREPSPTLRIIAAASLLHCLYN